MKLIFDLELISMICYTTRAIFNPKRIIKLENQIRRFRFSGIIYLLSAYIHDLPQCSKYRAYVKNWLKIHCN